MPFILKKYPTEIGKKVQLFLIQNLHLKPKIAQRLVDRGRVFKEDMTAYKISETIEEESLFLAEFEGQTRGLKPLLTFDDFALFDKPSNLMVHPISKKTPYSLLDEVRYHFGQDSNLIHRIDAETSGLVLIGQNLKSTIALKTMFEEKKYNKSYLAIVEGEIKEPIEINTALKKEGKRIGVRMQAGEEGKASLTIIKPIKYNKAHDVSLIEAIPVTGRQHQIRVHLYSIGHRIIGDPIYGVHDDHADDYLNKTLCEKKRAEVTKSHRLWLHANYLEFTYKGVVYKLYSKNDEIYKMFHNYSIDPPCKP